MPVSFAQNPCESSARYSERERAADWPDPEKLHEVSVHWSSERTAFLSSERTVFLFGESIQQFDVSSDDFVARTTFPDELNVLPDTTYRLITPIPIQVTCVGIHDWTASFKEANIAMSGNSYDEAKNSLAYDILYTLEDFSAEEGALIPALQDTLRVLRTYIREQDG